ncbi:Tubulin-like protein [Botrimarina colliarenosi]|uniref:Tubulin-like protein n=1 Tax=Botrimarina colliarenosi TaxID=2528001 RepID=A0A5C6AL22_9BACT|nr:tubulin-like doman-containing protein [Botrimarina colliarenosi]TWT99721.1 Tubulin-like protein [Botrimarina colliarenosi]
MSDLPQQPEVKLPGYDLVEKIGAGGYGEVWSATAPGGIRKAVKFVFGNEYDKRATSEMHALEKIKAVRHPFLLSLDRIEVVDGRLIVVSELADGSLRDRFSECLTLGMPGIPRAELLGYLSDAADALDFISERNDLAHLDIKPENLLLVAGHVKVADFGLVKSLSNQAQASLVGGMTPTYAAPEVFRGTPTRQSDQYSLAILYQEMLTGALPFSGVNAAELTLQHMKDDPELGYLEDGDRFAVSRALAKDPLHRYESAKAFVEALRSASDTAPSFGAETSTTAACRASARPPASKPSRHSVTEVFEADAGEAFGNASEMTTMRPPALANATPQEVAAPVIDAGPFAAAPAVFIGIGGSGARVLRALRSQMHEHLGATAPLASAPMLLFDTDAQSLASASRGGERGLGLDATETVTLPLRRPQAYREKADLLLRWLGRRWLYNIPRSLQTEGIRPLGRLALIDHARQAFQRLRAVLTSAIDENSRQASTEAVGLPFDQPGLRVYVVASTAGGSGSGMSIDVAYAVRSIVSRLGVDDAKIIGVMTHSTFRETKRCELARVNSYAWLSEFEGLRRGEEGYPGDSGVGLPAHEPGVAAFDHTYFVPLGDQIDTPAFESAADEIAEYLFADAFTPGQRLLDACRESSDGGETGSTLRSFAIRSRDSQSEAEPTALERAALARVLRRWAGGESTALTPNKVQTTDQMVHGAVAFLGKTQLDSSTLASNCRSLIEASLGGDASAYFDAKLHSDDSSTLDEFATKMDRSFGIVNSDSPPRQVRGKSIESIVEPITTRLADEAVCWTLNRVNDTQERLEGASRAILWLDDYLVAVDGDLAKVATNIETERVRLTTGNANDTRFKLFRLRLDAAALVAARTIAMRLRSRLQSLRSELDTLRSVVVQLDSMFTDESEAPSVSGEVERFSIAVEQRLQADYLAAHGGLLAVLSGETPTEVLEAMLAHAAQKVSREEASTVRAAADAALAAGFAAPPLADCGGVFRRLTLEQPSRREGLDGNQNELLLVTEMSGVSLPHVAASLIGGRRDYAAFAERIRSRRDIAWNDPVISSFEEPAKPLFETAGSQPQATVLIG